MNLSQDEITLFYKLWLTLLWGVNEKHKLVRGLKRPVYGQPIDGQKIFQIRQKLWEHPEWIDEFLKESDTGVLTELERGIIGSWRKYFISGEFIIFKQLQKYAVLISTEANNKIYGVQGISEPVEDVSYYELPALVKMVLLPFRGKIVFDTFITPYDVYIGKGIREDLKASYNTVKAQGLIIENLPEKPKTPRIVKTAPEKVPAVMQKTYDKIARLITDFSNKKLNEEYKKLCLRALVKLSRKRPSPISRGKAETWACGIIYAIGQINFIFDKSQKIHLKPDDIVDQFGIAKTTAGAKANEIRKLLKISHFSEEYLLAEHAERYTDMMQYFL